MGFYFQETVISGSRSDTHGVRKGMDDIETAMTAMGWSTYDDERASATSRLIMYNEGGETTSSGIYLVVTSGTTEILYFQLANSWDNVGHTFDDLYIPAAEANAYMQVDHDASWVLWVSGDKDSVTFVSKTRGAYGHVIAGRGAKFYDDDFEPYSCYILTNPNIVHTFRGAGDPANHLTRARVIAGNPPRTHETGEAEFLKYAIGTNNEPRIGMGQDDTVFTATPILYTADDASPLAKGALGIVKNAWVISPYSAGVHDEMRFTVEGSSEEYMAFQGTTVSLLIRRA
jgi:hypothetical protein